MVYRGLTVELIVVVVAVLLLGCAWAAPNPVKVPVAPIHRQPLFVARKMCRQKYSIEQK